MTPLSTGLGLTLCLQVPSERWSTVLTGESLGLLSSELENFTGVAHTFPSIS